jgi:hypothetical protein
MTVNMTDADIDKIAADAYKELEPQKDKEEKPEELPEEQPEKEGEPQKETPEKEGEPQKQDKPGEEKKEEPAKETPEPEKSDPEEKPLTEEEVRKIAVDEQVTLDEAKSRIEARQNIVKKYKGDPIELAKAYQSTQSAYDKLKVEHDKLLNAPDYDVIEQEREKEAAKIPVHVKENADKIIAEMRKKFPHRTEQMTDEAILEDFEANLKQRYDQYVQSKRDEIKTKAAQVRVDLLKDIDETNRQFIPEIKEILDKTSDVHLLSKSFTIKDTVQFVRGRHYTPERIEQLKKEAFERGKQEPKIISQKVPPQPQGSKTVVKEKTSSLNEKQKAYAQSMFENVTEERACELFREVYEKDLKKNSNFLP